MIKTFINFTDFHNFVLQNESVFSANNNVMKLKKTIMEMQTGCPCNRKKFLGVVEQLYQNLGQHLTTQERISIKQILGAGQVQFQHAGTTFLIF